jgi:hypothetical protein
MRSLTATVEGDGIEAAVATPVPDNMSMYSSSLSVALEQSHRRRGSLAARDSPIWRRWLFAKEAA